MKCSRCLKVLSPDDTVTHDGNHAVHLDCGRPRGLSCEERALLFRYCFDHAVIECPRCAQDFRQNELAADLVGGRTNLCPRCRMDLTERLREHLYGCVLLPGEVRRRAREARAAARQLVLVKGSDQLHDRADVLTREAEAAIAALREIMMQASGG